jgi:hypothetical protein
LDKYHPVSDISQPVLAGISKLLSYDSGLLKHHWSKIWKALGGLIIKGEYGLVSLDNLKFSLVQ